MDQLCLAWGKCLHVEGTELQIRSVVAAGQDLEPPDPFLQPGPDHVHPVRFNCRSIGLDEHVAHDRALAWLSDRHRGGSNIVWVESSGGMRVLDRVS